MLKDAAISKQLPLAINLNAEANFTEFCWSGNELLKQQLFNSLNGKGDKQLHISGDVGSGKSHLLQACCQHVSSDAKSAIYLPLKLLQDTSPEIFDGMEEHALLCVDDVEVIAQNKAWEEALFHLYNRIRDNGRTILITTSQVAPQHLPLALPDLRTRLAWSLVLQLHELSDDDKITALQALAMKRGFVLSVSVCHYLLNRCTRNMHDLLELLNRLDVESLIAQRRITIPFVKRVLSL